MHHHKATDPVARLVRTHALATPRPTVHWAVGYNTVDDKERCVGMPHERGGRAERNDLPRGKEPRMLSIVFGDVERSVYHPPTYFDNTYQDEWITDPRTVEMVRDVDRSEVVSARAIDSPVLGSISVKELSGGVKTLILMLFDDTGRIFNASACGDNCAKWICRIAREKELTINLHHVMDFSACEPFEARMVNTGRTVRSFEEYLDEALRIEER